MVAVGDPGHPALQALVRWDPLGFAEREIGERQAARLPPASRVATLTGRGGASRTTLGLLGLPAGAEVLGPVPQPPSPDPTDGGRTEWRAVVRVPRARGADLSAALREMQRLRSGPQAGGGAGPGRPDRPCDALP